MAILKQTPLDVAVCPGCGRRWTRDEMAARMWRLRCCVFICDCEFEWNDSPYRPLTIREILDGKASLPLSGDVDIDAYTRSVVALVREEAGNGKG